MHPERTLHILGGVAHSSDHRAELVPDSWRALGPREPPRLGSPRQPGVLIVEKARQLSRRIDDYRAQRFELDGVDRQHVQRIWPILLTGAGLLMAEMVYDWLVEEIGEHLQQPTVQPLTTMDMSDWEQLCGLVEAGWSVPKLLARKVGGYQRLDWRRMVFDDPYLPSDARASAVLEKADAAFRSMIEGFGWDASRLHR